MVNKKKHKNGSRMMPSTSDPPQDPPNTKTDNKLDPTSILASNKRKKEDSNLIPTKIRITENGQPDESDMETSSISSSIENFKSPNASESSVKVNNKVQQDVVPQLKYTSKDNGPYVIYAKHERIKEVTFWLKI